jgi:hypothetical protein
MSISISIIALFIEQAMLNIFQPVFIRLTGILRFAAITAHKDGYNSVCRLCNSLAVKGRLNTA